LHVLVRPRQDRRGALLGGKVDDVTFQPDGYRVVLSSGLFYDSARPPRIGSRVRVRLPVECIEEITP
jgi:hypothetical protein